jgi:hypothetical protein
MQGGAWSGGRRRGTWPTVIDDRDRDRDRGRDRDRDHARAGDSDSDRDSDHDHVTMAITTVRLQGLASGFRVHCLGLRAPGLGYIVDGLT